MPDRMKEWHDAETKRWEGQMSKAPPEPKTAAGRRLLDCFAAADGVRAAWLPYVIAIEDEAVAAERERLAAEVGALPTWDKRSVPGGIHVRRADVLALLSDATPLEPQEYQARSADECPIESMSARSDPLSEAIDRIADAISAQR